MDAHDLHALMLIGYLNTDQGPGYKETILRFRGREDIRNLPPSFWAGCRREFDDIHLIWLFKGLVVLEEELEWVAYPDSPAVELYRTIREAGLDPDLTVADFALQNCGNPWVPFGTRYPGYRTAVHYQAWLKKMAMEPPYPKRPPPYMILVEPTYQTLTMDVFRSLKPEDILVGVVSPPGAMGMNGGITLLVPNRETGDLHEYMVRCANDEETYIAAEKLLYNRSGNGPSELKHERLYKEYDGGYGNHIHIRIGAKIDIAHYHFTHDSGPYRFRIIPDLNGIFDWLADSLNLDPM